ncbi:MAG TPA: anhydro-N-acetylmuramic acid kinase, partial [Caulobacteraceae bacterium]|nr:anhydro-N-acetylmuramic acid kinase [Caulobacteraceae bacterium]
IRDRLPFPALTAEDVHWRGDSIEAEAFAYLAARCLLGLPISFPRTTGVAEPMTGGRIVQP